jgi:ATP-dependent DNA helicase PIF1
MVEFQLTKNQQQIYDAVVGSDNCVLIHGKPGVGKSVLIRALRDTGAKHYTLGAPTGLAALNIGGKTLHSIFGITPSEGIFQSDYNKFTTNINIINFIQHRLHHLIIDEISMVRADMLDYIDRLLREVKNVDKPFGGVQVIAFGDFFQLPPVAKSSDVKELKADGYDSEFAFDSKVFKQNFKSVVLNQVHRQSDPIFLNLLDAIRNGKVTGKHITMLNARVSKVTDVRIILTPLNRQADVVNQSELKAIKEPSQTYEATKYGYWPANPIDQLTVKVGAQVMIKKNGADRPPNLRGPFESKVVNGTLGKVVELPSKDSPAIKVEIETGEVVNIYVSRWERLEKEKIDGKWSEKVVASYEQFPLQLAWAISIHKSQGQTFERAHINPQSMFAAGQFYVALSRVKSLEGVSLEGPVSQRTFMVDKRVLNFVTNL